MFTVHGRSPSHARALSEYLCTTLGVGLATLAFWLSRHYLDRGQASLLYLPVVISCSVWFGFGPAVFGAVLSFLCWNFFFLPPHYTLVVSDPKEWLALFVFLLVAITTARLASLAQDRARAAQELAETAARAEALREADMLKEALLSLVSHELRTPLAAIKAAASGLIEPGAVWEEGARRDIIASIDREADRLSTVVSNLLDLSRLEAGSWNPERDWCDPGEIVSTVLDRLTQDEADRVRVAVDDGMPMIKADYVQIALVLTNMLRNALKYTPEGSAVDVTVTKAADRVVFAVRDYGAGIEPAEAPELFKRFYRGARHRQGPVHGTGLGLALCEAIVRAHGGTIAAGNAGDGEPAGAVFTVALSRE
jgi:two-component system sensor histidine kinase KdpD